MAVRGDRRVGAGVAQGHAGRARARVQRRAGVGRHARQSGRRRPERREPSVTATAARSAATSPAPADVGVGRTTGITRPDPRHARRRWRPTRNPSSSNGSATTTWSASRSRTPACSNTRWECRRLPAEIGGAASTPLMAESGASRASPGQILAALAELAPDSQPAVGRGCRARTCSRCHSATRACSMTSLGFPSIPTLASGSVSTRTMCCRWSSVRSSTTTRVLRFGWLWVHGIAADRTLVRFPLVSMPVRHERLSTVTDMTRRAAGEASVCRHRASRGSRSDRPDWRPRRVGTTGAEPGSSPSSARG